MEVLRGAEPRSVFACVENQMEDDNFGEKRDGPDYLEINCRDPESSPNSCEEPRSSGSFRAELKRPDLKGTFRCSICAKVFCHSSSLSRHRMQAHFKSYKCTLCRKDITSNETLRTHMYKQHQISRMFMCRCCNWAFPDKTSLHMHIQAQEEGKAVSVPVIGKGMTPGDKLPERSAFAPIGNPMPHMPPPGLPPAPISFFPAAPPPPLPHSHDDLGRLRERLMLNQLMAQQSFGLPWLNQLPKPIPTTRPLELCRMKEEELEINVDKDDGKCDDEDKLHSSDSDEPKSESSGKSSGSPCVNADSSSSTSTGVSSPSSPVNLFKKDTHAPSAFHNLSVDSLRPPFISPHVSPTETHSSISPDGQCFDCAVSKTKLTMAENKSRYLESRANALQAEAVRAQSTATAAEGALRVLETETRALRDHTEQLQRRLLDCQEQALRFAQSDRTSCPQSVVLFLNQLIQSSIIR